VKLNIKTIGAIAGVALLVNIGLAKFAASRG
jgi:hypothetical protein